MRKRAVIVLAAGIWAASSAPPVPAVVAAAVPGSWIAGYATPVVVAPSGGPLTLVNGDLEPHDFLALNATRPAGSAPWCAFLVGPCPLFWSEIIGLGATTTVQGLEGLPTGSTYDFYCSVHPWMLGTLVIA